MSQYRWLQREKLTITMMIRLYCRHHHPDDYKQNHNHNDCCDDCRSLIEYCWKRSDNCRSKPKLVCAKCRIHCYQPEMRRKIKQVMRYAGPRMLLYHPVLAVKHLLRIILAKQ
jgi:hypothetical protein